MQFSETEFRKVREFYGQTDNVSVSFSGYVDSNTGIFRLGVSGSPFDIVLSGGGIYYDDNFLQSYLPFQPFSVEAQYSKTSTNILKDSQPLIIGQEKVTGVLNAIYVERDNLSDNFFFNASVAGDTQPNVDIQKIGYLTLSGQEAVTGRFNNLGGLPIKIFRSVMLPVNGYSFNGLTGNIEPSQSGSFSFKADFDVYPTDQPLYTTFQTSFADYSVSFQIIDLRALDSYILINDVGELSFNEENEINQIVSYNNFSGGFISDFPTYLNISLSYVSGSGNFVSSDFSQYGNGTGLLIGNLMESGLLTGQVVIKTGDSQLTGEYIMPIVQFAYATGFVSRFYSGDGTGYGTGTSYSGACVGAFTGIMSGVIYDGSGRLYFDGAVYGLPVQQVYSLNPTGYANATGFVNVTSSAYGDVLYINDLNIPILNGYQFTNTLSLYNYLTGNQSIHKVTPFISGADILLTANDVGVLGNGLRVEASQCNLGSILHTMALTGGQSIGPTGIVCQPSGTYQGYAQDVLINSGQYTKIFSGDGTGLFYYTRVFTDNWKIYTGTSFTGLAQITQNNGQSIFNSGSFQPNSSFVLKITHDQDIINPEGAILIVSGDKVQNPINQLLFN